MELMTRTAATCLLVLVATLNAAGLVVHAQTYPAKTVRILVPAAAGDSCDTLSRLIAPKVSERLGQQFVVDNRPGAGGQLGLQLAAQSPADGYTIACGQGGNMVLAPIVNRKVPYDTLKDFVPVAALVSNFPALVVHPSVPFRNVKDLVVYAKANPGKLTFGTNGEGAFVHFSTELLRLHAGFTYLHVPYKSVQTIVTEIMGGRIDSVFTSFINVQPHIMAGRLRLLGIGRATRAPNYPDLPAISETLPGFQASGWFGIIAPAGTPRDVVLLLNREINRALALPEVRDRLTSFALEVHTEPPEYFGEILRRDIDKWGKLARDIGFKPL
jgi:tripartite-type tricarboxylate transporter receptor subunit TctC